MLVRLCGSLVTCKVTVLKSRTSPHPQRRSKAVRGPLEAYKELAKLWFEEVWNKGRREAIRELLAPGAEISDGTDARKGTEGFYPFFDRMQAAFSDIRFSVQDVLAEGDKVCLRWLCTMRHNGVGMIVSNRELQTTGITIVQIANGKFVAVWRDSWVLWNRSRVNRWRRFT